MDKHRIFTTELAKVYPLYVQKAEPKNRTKDDIPTKRPHFFFLIVGKKYFALKKCESKFVAIVFRHVVRSSSSIERFGK
jgi:hypothetical protein